MSYGAFLWMAALTASTLRRTMRVRYDHPPIDPKERERRDEEERKRQEKRASRATYHARLMEKQRAQIARIEAMRAEDAARAAQNGGVR